MTSKEIKTRPVRIKVRPVEENTNNASEPSQPAIYFINKICSVFENRGSATPVLEQAADYGFYILQQAGLKTLRKDRFPGAASTYRPYLLAFLAGALGCILAAILPGTWTFIAGALLCDLGLAGFLAQAGLSSSWMEWFIPKGMATNISGRVPAAEQCRQTVLIAAHLDAHRTPIFYSSPTWQKAFRFMITAAAASLAAGFIFCILGWMMLWIWVRWITLVLALILLGMAFLCWHADRTPYSPAANDNASGVAVALRLAQQVSKSPLKNTEVWFLVNDCEETGSAGMAHFLTNHGGDIGRDCLIFCPDEIGNTRLQYITRDGLVLPVKSQARILTLAEKAAQAVDGFSVNPARGLAYTDATLASKLGYAAVSLVSLPDEGEVSHWHQVSDQPEYIKRETLAQAETYLLKVLEIVDREAASVPVQQEVKLGEDQQNRTK